ncbi:MAG: DUF294 nucleotidyltransferase-like domain-containing protein [SAR324 cluster bacterium]|nr:DUF294 nucleotidyltransferase-like domain-containing protein [SAR324 cluster bacterium]
MPISISQDLRDLISTSPIILPLGTSLQEAATNMAEKGLSVFLVSDDSGNLVGIVTDQDLRVKGYAKGLSASHKVQEIMSSPLECFPPTMNRMDALNHMLVKKRHHLVIMEDGKCLGLVGKDDFIQERTHSPLFLARRVARSTQISQLTKIFSKLPQTMQALLDEGISLREIAPLFSHQNDLILRKAVELTEKNMPTPPPQPYVFLVLGSEGRGEQSFKTDQDNAILYQDPPAGEEESTAAWFLEYGCLLADRLNDIGFPYCLGEIMASNPKWNQPLSKWKDYFSNWITHPTPQEVLQANIFFDFKGVYGDIILAERLEEHLTNILGQGNPIFFANLAKNALSGKPALGFFGKLQTQSSGPHKDAIDLKKKALALIVDITRCHALKHGIHERGTMQRLVALGQIKGLKICTELLEAYFQLQILRIKNQLHQIQNGREPDNHLEVGLLPQVDQAKLKASLQIIEQAQKHLLEVYAGGIL